MTPEEVLLKAADDIAERGHAKSVFYDCKLDGGTKAAWETAPACALGAIGRTLAVTKSGELAPCAIEDLENHEAVRRLAASILTHRSDLIRLRVDGGDCYDVITEFNDMPETTGEDVILAMKRAAHDG